MYSFKELLPHHVRYTTKVFRSFSHLYETRADNGLLEYIQGYNQRASLPHEQTCQQIMQAPAPRTPAHASPHMPVASLRPLTPPRKPAWWIALCSMLFRPPLPPDVHCVLHVKQDLL